MPGHSGHDHTACEGGARDTEASACRAAHRRRHEGRHSGGLSLPPHTSRWAPGGASSSVRASRPRGSTGPAVSRGRGHRRGLCAKTNSVRGDRDHAFLYLGSGLPSPKYRRLCGGCRGAGPARLDSQQKGSGVQALGAFPGGSPGPQVPSFCSLTILRGGGSRETTCPPAEGHSHADGLEEAEAWGTLPPCGTPLLQAPLWSVSTFPARSAPRGRFPTFPWRLRISDGGKSGP